MKFVILSCLLITICLTQYSYSQNLTEQEICGFIRSSKCISHEFKNTFKSKFTDFHLVQDLELDTSYNHYVYKNCSSKSRRIAKSFDSSNYTIFYRRLRGRISFEIMDNRLPDRVYPGYNSTFKHETSYKTLASFNKGLRFEMLFDNPLARDYKIDFVTIYYD